MSTAISIKNVSKKYVIGKQKDGSLRGTLAGLFAKQASTTEEFWALNDVSFDIQQGDVVGIIGKNGAGKSTLLKILSQITKPTTGSIELNGRVASLLEVGTGFHPELTGRENVYLNGTILGMTRKEVAAKFDEIVAFSGVEKFIDTPVKHYSSGMYVRLAFAVAAHLEPEILIIDEVLAVGDAEFQKKCLGKMGEVAGQGRTVIFVSHDLAAVKTLCTKGVLMSKGTLKFHGSTNNAIDKYINDVSDNSKPFYTNLNSKYIQNVATKNTEKAITNEFDFQKCIDVYLDFETNELTVGTFIGVAVLDSNKSKVFTNHFKLTEKKRYSMIYKIPKETLTPGNYSFDVALFSPGIEVYEYVNDICPISIIDTGSDFSQFKDYGNVFINCKWHEIV